MRKITFPQMMLLLSLLLLAVTLFKPRFSIKQSTYRYVFVFDISQSMNVKDVGKSAAGINTELKARIDLAKEAAIHSLSNFPCNTEVGIALFTGHRSFLLMDPVESCKNLHDLNKTIEMIDWTTTWKARSEIAKGLYKSIRLMKRIGGETRLVFFTDGHEAPPVNPNQLPRFPGKMGDVKGLVVGIGGDKLAQIPKYDRETGDLLGFWKSDEVVHVDVYTQAKNKREGIKLPIGFEHMSSLREPYLQGLSEKTGLIYFRLQEMSQLSSQLKNKKLSIPKVISSDIRWIFALFSILIFIALYLIEPWKKNFKRRS